MAQDVGKLGEEHLGLALGGHAGALEGVEALHGALPGAHYLAGGEDGGTVLLIHLIKDEGEGRDGEGEDYPDGPGGDVVVPAQGYDLHGLLGVDCEGLGLLGVAQLGGQLHGEHLEGQGGRGDGVSSLGIAEAGEGDRPGGEALQGDGERQAVLAAAGGGGVDGDGAELQAVEVGLGLGQVQQLTTQLGGGDLDAHACAVAHGECGRVGLGARFQGALGLRGGGQQQEQGCYI